MWDFRVFFLFFSADTVTVFQCYFRYDHILQIQIWTECDKYISLQLFQRWTECVTFTLCKFLNCHPMFCEYFFHFMWSFHTFYELPYIL